jgi:hypothetical protein
LFDFLKNGMRRAFTQIKRMMLSTLLIDKALPRALSVFGNPFSPFQPIFSIGGRSTTALSA